MGFDFGLLCDYICLHNIIYADFECVSWSFIGFWVEKFVLLMVLENEKVQFF